jgi:hypothetical protein
MLPILWRAEAQADLAAILEYTAERNPQSAFDLYDGIERVVSQLPHHPYLYRLGRRFQSRTAFHECAVVKMQAGGQAYCGGLRRPRGLALDAPGRTLKLIR